MAVKHFDIAGLGSVAIYKRRGMRSMRLSVTAAKQIRVTIPAWATYASGLSFAEKQSNWIQRHMPITSNVLRHDQAVGKSHRLRFISDQASSKPTRRVGISEITVRHPASLRIDDPTVQAMAAKASIEALRRQAEDVLPARLNDLAAEHHFAYSGVTVRQLKSRWGSCSSQKLIVLNLFLMQLPWEFIDYVLLHELTHTKHMNHGTDFWAEFIACEPRAKELRRAIRTYQPTLI
jgi:predicted metal-dependent hydrolase